MGATSSGAASTSVDSGTASLKAASSRGSGSMIAWAIGCGGQPCCEAIDTDYEYPGLASAERGPQLEQLLERLFRLQDLAGDGLLDEMELVKLNEKVAMLHYGREANNEDVSIRYKKLFREKLDPDGNPIPYEVFRKYMLGVLDELDPDETAQEMIIEQFIAEARLARRMFYSAAMKSEGDTPFRLQMEADPDELSVSSEVKSFSAKKSSPPSSYKKMTPPKTPPKGTNISKFSLVVTPPRVDQQGRNKQDIVHDCPSDERDTITTPLILKYSNN